MERRRNRGLGVGKGARKLVFERELLGGTDGLLDRCRYTGGCGSAEKVYYGAGDGEIRGWYCVGFWAFYVCKEVCEYSRRGMVHALFLLRETDCCIKRGRGMSF